ncbi:DUF3105 domain-containing protein [Nocardioides limicola]|uniref:DUF3105 domain-containing protein n=1 Tax=Nocardioides limicola TaxID=2803368 RepID=UPI0027DBB4FC|nr:DUF3105 domain-containing protein [Nocardioides sp. DJM-14]
MTKKNSAKADRRAVVDQLRSQQKNADRRRNMMIVGVSMLVAALIIGSAAYRPVKNWYDLQKFSGLDLSSIGAPADVCGEVTVDSSGAAGSHVAPGTPMTYPEAPPAFGDHWETWDPMERKFYTAADRPDLGMLVHNLEHGYAILWYDETAAADSEMMATIRGIASTFSGSTNYRMKFKAVPWTSADGDEFPEDQHIAFTRWSAGGIGNTDQAMFQGVWQYCSEPSGEALEQFMLEYPYMDSPEPNAS